MIFKIAFAKSLTSVGVLYWSENGSTDFYLASTVAVPADATLIVLGKDAPIFLEENQSIRGGASANSDLDVIISYEELDDAW